MRLLYQRIGTGTHRMGRGWAACCVCLMVVCLGFNTGVAAEGEPAKNGGGTWYYLAAVNYSLGMHQFTQNDDWVDSQRQTIEEDILLQGEDYESTNYQPNIGNKLLQSYYLEFEAMWGLNLGVLSDQLKEVKGIRIAAGAQLHPGFKLVQQNSGTLIYTDHATTAETYQEITYEGEIEVTERMMMMVPQIALMYFHENGVDGGGKAVPFVGALLGFPLVSVERKTTLDTNTSSVGDRSYKAEATIQESKFNAFSYRYGLLGGFQIQVHQEHHFNLRVSVVQQRTPIELQRRGHFNESINGAAYSLRVEKERRSVLYNFSGLSVSLGYTMRLK